MVDALLRTDVGEIRVYSRDEAKQHHMRTSIADRRIEYIIGDVRDSASIDAAMAGVDYVFHAAALKQVPACEFFPMQAVLTNVIGSDNVIRAAHRNRVQKVVCLSTDKAVYPINAMGITKALMEKLAQAKARELGAEHPAIACVRYGNVMYSRGSVIPLFVSQLRAGRPLTVTHPEMTRFLLPLATAIELVLYAFEHANPGDIFVRKAPASTVATLSAALGEVFNCGVTIDYIGVRHGEKLYETLATADELRVASEHGDYFQIPMDTRDLDYRAYYSEGHIVDDSLRDYTSHNTRRLDIAETAALLRTLPEIRRELGDNG